MIDCIFISPLGWSKHVWDKIITDERFNDKSYEIIEFLNNSFEDIAEAYIDKTIGDYLKNLSDEGVVITSSYGTVALISFLKRNNIKLNHLVVIDGLDIIPSLEELEHTFSCIEDRHYQNLLEYYDDMLSDEEKDDLELLRILNYNLILKNGVYSPTLDTQSTLSYLSMYSNLDIEKELCLVLNKIKKLFIFSSRSISIPHTKIKEENHLLMLKAPQKVLEKIFY